MNTPSSSDVIVTTGPRGRLLNADQIATTIFNQPQRSKWVRQTVAPTKKITLGRSTVFWWEQDVIDWINGHRG